MKKFWTEALAPAIGEIILKGMDAISYVMENPKASGILFGVGFILGAIVV